ncbi:zinc finger MYM-type protein 1-like protein [Tanacetum coccineum]
MMLCFVYIVTYVPMMVRKGMTLTFTIGGFSNWKKLERLLVHVGGIHSAHNKARRACEDLMNPEQHIGVSFFKQDQEVRIRYEITLLASVHCVRFCLHQGLVFRGHDETKESNNKGNFKELLKFLADHNEGIRKVVLDKAPGNHKLSSNKIQKDIAHAYA